MCDFAGTKRERLLTRAVRMGVYGERDRAATHVGKSDHGPRVGGRHTLVCVTSAHVLGSPAPLPSIFGFPFLLVDRVPPRFQLLPPKSLFVILHMLGKCIYKSSFNHFTILPPLLFYIRFQLYNACHVINDAR